ncbi:probable protein phosphatase 2C 75 isoform X3 [Manihot esculenta]|uniref:Uncharacterized protein n=3 Tax=Manihot esculenta TaxID=3983 RepID=A0ACB7HKZ6_MANES|nr:probable protein phosphatase 2C 75 isoform X3 [Manihot esculenta]KAG8652831.1 hypothetical protein MANES_06G139900v8 [Manihot esculenta]KAG8652832.1 hypothetical protein MANES_06G139900v8 [Manihot esculenta]KAG8652835.1 hypothetical protein MANES_06G139900v8 [Manihot esculenta]
MTEVHRRMLSDENEDSPAKCRERRRRRIEMRRLASVPGAGTPPPESESHAESSSCFANGKRIRKSETGDFPGASSLVSSGDDVETEAVQPPSGFPLVEPTFGTMSVAGRLREMEDAITVCTNLCRPEINERRPVHFFAVYDGHGGSHVAELCRERMHVILEGELMRVDHTDSSENGNGSSSGISEKRQLQRQGGDEVEKWRTVLKRSFEKMDEAALNTCACGCVGFECTCHPMDMEVALGGSTAVLALLTQEHIVVANCGDSRAVLCRGGRAIPLSFDQKPDRPDELARIEAAGGHVIFVNGARVEGILAMSRAIGILAVCPNLVKPWSCQVDC